MRLLLRASVLAFAGLIAACTTTPSAPSAEAADVILMNGKVFTADGRNSVQQAVAVKGERFLAVGSNSTVEAHRGPGTKVVDLGGRLVIPGIGDDHFHNEGGGPGIDLTGVRSVSELLDKVRERVRGAGAGEVITSNPDWHEAQLREQRLPTRAELDAAAPDNPVVLIRGGHEYILNSAAFRRWNITKDTPSPAGGIISKDASGELTGELFDNAMNLVTLPASPPLGREDILKTQRAVHPYGITSVRVPGSYKGDLKTAYRLMQQVRDEGALGLRYTIYLPGFDLQSADAARGLIASWGVPLDAGDDWLRIAGVKLMIDGGFEGGHMRRPYNEPYGRNGTYSGVATVAPGPYTEVVRELNRLGWRVTTHAVGDAAMDQALAAYEAADRERPLAGRLWSIEHAFIAQPEQLPRLKKLDIALSVQDHLYIVAPVLKKYWGADRASQVTPLKSYLDAGLLVAGGTDSYVIPFNPFYQLYHFLTRDTVSDGVYGANQAVTSRPELLRLVTINYAKLVGEEAKRGSIEAGKLADFAVLTEDFLTVEPSRIPGIKALATYVGGREVYRDPSF